MAGKSRGQKKKSRDMGEPRENGMKKKWKARKIDRKKVMKMARLKKRSERTRKKH